MTFSETELDQIEKMASLYLPISDMAVILGKPEHELRTAIGSSGSAARQAYLKGKTGTKLELRKQEMQLARIGSPLALENLGKALMDMEDDE